MRAFLRPNLTAVTWSAAVAGLLIAAAVAAPAPSAGATESPATQLQTAGAALSTDELLDALEDSPYAGSTGRAGSVLRLYTTVFLRLPDQGGFDYWVETSGWGLREMAAFFVTSEEFQETYGSLDDRAFVEQIYRNVLGRDGENAGVDYWIGIAGMIGRAEVVIGFSESAEYIDATTFEQSAPAAGSCEEIAATFVTKGSANPTLADPEASATCIDDMVTVTSNGIPDYSYIQTSPGDPQAQDLEFSFPATPTMATETTDIPLLGSMAVAINGVPIYGPTEGTGGDVLSLVGALSECGSHNGPTGFHMHLFGTSSNTDCMYTPAEAAAAPQLIGYAFDGYPIYTGNDQYISSWELTTPSVFSTATWEAHSYVAGSGDLDECNGLTDSDGNYAYYTTDTFPYVMGCYKGEVELVAGPGGGPGPGR